MRGNRKYYYIYPEYLDKNLTRKEGRRVPQDIAVLNPAPLEIKLAAKKLNLSIKAIKDGAYPRQWWNRRGIFLIEKKYPKLETLKKLATTITHVIRPEIERKRKELIEKKKKEQELLEKKKRQERLKKIIKSSTAKKHTKIKRRKT